MNQTNICKDSRRINNRERRTLELFEKKAKKIYLNCISTLFYTVDQEKEQNDHQTTGSAWEIKNLKNA